MLKDQCKILEKMLESCLNLWTKNVWEPCVNVNAYSPDIPVGLAACTVFGTRSFTVSSPLGRIHHLCTMLQLRSIITI